MNAVASWLNKEYTDVPPLHTGDRKDYGIHHPITGMLLCPVRYDWSDEGVSSLILSAHTLHAASVRDMLRAAHPKYDYTFDMGGGHLPPYLGSSLVINLLARFM